MTKQQIKNIIDQAIKYRKTLQIVYFKSDGQISRRTISKIVYALDDMDTIKVNQYNLDNDYIIGYCHLRNERRTFKIDRIIEVNTV